MPLLVAVMELMRGSPDCAGSKNIISATKPDALTIHGNPLKRDTFRADDFSFAGSFLRHKGFDVLRNRIDERFGGLYPGKLPKSIRSRRKRVNYKPPQSIKSQHNIATVELEFKL